MIMSQSSKSLAAVVACFLLAPLPLLVGQAKEAGRHEWVAGVPFHTDWDDAIAEVQKTGKLLFIYNGWPLEGT
ncbi:MAG: hypothetical protein AB8H80_22640 [Planctomycetota bacterium]